MGLVLATRHIGAGELLQHVSRVVYRDKPLHYGSDGTNRYDAPDSSYGVLYPSRNNYPQLSVALFERARGKVRVVEDIDLRDHVDWPRFVEDYRLGVEPDPGPPGEDPAGEQAN